ncbi:helix-turn-helix transcriptional regulator [Pectinatus frisingensis]|uniref:helix-turn-helix transcriptional regulator n=1 Tax=Pectinatus frisingensis TaxID=865 RepID=UPI001E577632|nr:helix-turn-helix transcriptional regulator [Pectinatus frisingensis]
MIKAGVDFTKIKTQMLSDNEVKKEYDKLKPRYELISQLIKVRSEKQLTQEELAKMMGTQKSNISRLESGNYNPSLDFIIKAAHSLGKELEIVLK